MSNPVLINDLRRNFFRRRPVLCTFLMALGILVLTFTAVATMNGSPSSVSRQIPLNYLLDLMLPLVVPAFAAGSFAREHEQRTWDDVLLTNLGGWEIIRGKFMACLLPTVVSILVMFPPFAMLLILQGIPWAYGDAAWVPIILIRFSISAYFYIALVMLCSYYGRTGRTTLVVSYVMIAAFALVNYVVWAAITPIFAANTYDPNAYTSQYMYQGAYSDQRPDSLGLISSVELASTVQALFLGTLLLVFLRTRLGRRG